MPSDSTPTGHTPRNASPARHAKRLPAPELVPRRMGIADVLSGIRRYLNGGTFREPEHNEQDYDIDEDDCVDVDTHTHEVDDEDEDDADEHIDVAHRDRSPTQPSQTTVQAPSAPPTSIGTGDQRVRRGTSGSSRRREPLLQRAEAPRAGVPARYDDGVQWLRSGLRRHPWAVAVGLIFGWTGVWIAFWGAMAGAFIGLLVGFGVSGRTIPIFSSFGVGQAVTVLGVLGGVALGIIGGFLIVLAFLVRHPIPLLGSIISGAIIAAFLVVGSAAFERLGLRIRGYRRLSRDEARRLAPLVKEIAETMDLPGLPRFAMSDQLVPNAWAQMRTIVLTTGLLQTLDDSELRAILVHELSHWRNGDAVGLQCVWAAAWPVVLLYNLGTIIGGQTPSDRIVVSNSLASAIRWIVALLVAWPAWVMTKLIIAPLTAASQRRYEYGADAVAYEFGLGAQMSSALRKISAFEAGRTGWEAAMTATHPPTELRLEALQAPRPDHWEYHEDELRGPSWPEVRRLFGGLSHVTRR